MLLPVMHIFLDQSLIESNDSLEQVDCLFAVIDLSGRELVHRLVVGLELASFEEWDRVLHQRHCRKLCQVFVIVKLTLTSLNTSLQLNDSALNLIFAHEN